MQTILFNLLGLIIHIQKCIFQKAMQQKKRKDRCAYPNS